MLILFCCGMPKLFLSDQHLLTPEKYLKANTLNFTTSSELKHFFKTKQLGNQSYTEKVKPKQRQIERERHFPFRIIFLSSVYSLRIFLFSSSLKSKFQHQFLLLIFSMFKHGIPVLSYISLCPKTVKYKDILKVCGNCFEDSSYLLFQLKSH